MMMMKKCSFDFDSTLDRVDVQRFAIELIEKGWDVWIVTSRCDTERALAKGWHWVERQNEQLYKVANDVGIKRENIIFTEHVDKIVYLKDKGFLFHLDDDVDELMAIRESGDECYPICVDYFEWQEVLRKEFKI
jgi:hypothetical protein